MVTRDSKLVKVSPDRGWNDGLYVIVRYGPRECNIRSINGRVEDTIYTAHLFRDGECIRQEKVWLAERAANIGRK